jgi:tRNA-uridine 2-sulfurtransferase
MRVVLAMSGGVDSSVAALLLKEQGHEVIGLFMRTGVHAPDDDLPSHKKGCCSAIDASDARRVADRLELPFYALDFESDFARVMDYFTDEYLAGRTPNPCVVCNTWLKFGKLWDYGRQLGADRIATGHYAQIVPQDGSFQLHRAADPAKDQSYVLFDLRKELLSKLQFPIGGYRKEEIRALARAANLGVAEKPDSVEICFVPGGDHAEFIRSRRPGLATAGHFVDTAGRVLADHGGYERYTIGQRKGLGFAAGERRYVLEIVPERNEVVVGDPDQLLARGLRAARVNWLIDPPAGQPLGCQAKIRYRHPGAQASVTAHGSDALVEFIDPQSAVTPGQAVVFYDGSQVLGGGWIEESFQQGGTGILPVYP